MQIRWARQWRATAGQGWGLPQPVLYGVLSVTDVSPAQVHELHRRMVLLMGEDARHSPGAAQPASLWLLECVARWTGALQRHFRVPVSQQSVVAPVGEVTDATARAFVALPCAHHRSTRLALQWMQRLLAPQPDAAVAIDWSDDGARLKLLEQIGKEFRRFSERGTNTFGMVLGATRLGIPVRRITDRLHQLGIGRQARWIDSTVTDQTPALGVRLAHDKEKTALVLRHLGLPVPIHELASSQTMALAVAKRMGWPLVVKPADQEQGNGVTADIRDEALLLQAWTAASKFSRKILVERWVAGDSFRLTVMHGQVVRITHRVAGGVVGDGVSTVAALVDALARDPQHQRQMRLVGKPAVGLDEEAVGLLRQQGRSPDTVPAAGERVRLRRRDNLSAGGSATVLTPDQVHSDNLQVAIDAAAALRLDMAGIDLICTDITRSWRDTGAVICEVNAQPQIVAPDQPEVYERVVESLFRDRERVPCKLVICPDDPAAVEVILRRQLRAAAGHGVSATSGLWMAGQCVSQPFANSLDAGLGLLARSDLQRATCLMPAQEILRLGMPLHQWDRVICARELLPELAQRPQLVGMLSTIVGTRLLHESPEPAG